MSFLTIILSIASPNFFRATIKEEALGPISLEIFAVEDLQFSS